ncbi:MAG: glycosyltransferase, partial [Muribaculaceae bacterium]
GGGGGIKIDRIHLICSTLNQGSSKTRQIGLDYAQGKYFMFVDSDDILEKNALSSLVNIAERYKCDVVAFQMRRFFINKYISTTCLSSPEYATNRLLEKKELTDYYKSYFGVNILPVNLVCKLYLRETWIKADIQPWPYFLGEDLMANLQLHPYINRMYISSEIAYNYRYGGGTTTADYHKTIETAIALYKERKRIAIENEHRECLRPLCIELKNYIKCAISSCCLYRKHYIQSDITEFDKYLADECFQDFHSLSLRNPDPIDTAILDFDTKKAFELTLKTNELKKVKNSIKIILKKIASLMN